MNMLFPPTLPCLIRRPLNSTLQLIARHTSGRRETHVDLRRDIIHRALSGYPPNVRNKAIPTGLWQPDTMHALRKAIPSIQTHETIECAFKLYIRHQCRHRQAELDRKYECMCNTMSELKKVDLRLAFEVNKVEDPRVRTEAEIALMKSQVAEKKGGAVGRIRGLFPQELKTQTDTSTAERWVEL